MIFFIALIFLSHRDSYRKLASTSTKHLFKYLSCTWVQLNRTKLSIGCAFSFFVINWCSFYFYLTTNVLSIKLINVRWNLIYLISSITSNSEPFTGNWNREFIFTLTGCFCIEYWCLIQAFPVSTKTKIIWISAPCLCHILFLWWFGLWTGAKKTCEHFINRYCILIMASKSLEEKSARL